MRIGWFVVKKRTRRIRRRAGVKSVHYLAHKEYARNIILERLAHWNEFYQCTYYKVAIRNQSTRWGSCSLRGNLNFNYKVALLPEHLMDYVIVHELCHLIEFNHSRAFWDCMERALPDCSARKNELQRIPMHTLEKEQCVL